MEKLLNSTLDEYPKYNSSTLIVQHTGAYKQAEEFADSLEQKLGIMKTPITHQPSAIIIHSGPGILCVSFYVI